jgi:hypothetical protein
MTIDDFCKAYKCTPTETKNVKLYLIFLRWIQMIDAIFDTKRSAQLVDAAPDLLAACQAAINATGGSANWKGETEKFLKLCEAAVAKATNTEASNA